MALGWLWGAYRLAINTLCSGFDVALMWLWVAWFQRGRKGELLSPVGMLTVIELAAGISTFTSTAVFVASAESYSARITPLFAEG